MPTYPYACTACDHTFETVQSFADDTLTECPVCDGRLRKIFSSVGVVFKGSGFYRTDSRDAAKATAAAASPGDSGKGKDAASTKDAGAGKDSAASTPKTPAATASSSSGTSGSASDASGGGSSSAA